MKSIRKSILAIAVAFIAAFTSCNSDEFTPTVSVKNADGTTIVELTVPAEGLEERLDIVANVSWQIDFNADWITVDVLKVDNNDEKTHTNPVNITVDPNNGAARETTLNIIIPGTSIQLTVKQEGNDSEIEYVAGVYCGDYYENGTANWEIQLGDKAYNESAQGSDEGYCFVLDLIAPATSTLDKGLPVGSFTIEDSGNAGTATTNSGKYCYSAGELTDDSLFFDEGTIVVTGNGNDSYTVTVNAKSGNDTIEFSFTGIFELYDDSTPVLDGDIALNKIDEVDCIYYVDSESIPYWEIAIWNAEPAYVLYLPINVTSTSFAAGIPSGTYTVSDSNNLYEQWTIDYGTSDEYGAWLYTFDSDYYPDKATAMIAKGSLVVSSEGTTHKFVIDLIDAADNKITGTFEGVDDESVIFVDGTTQTASAPVRGTTRRTTLRKVSAANSTAATTLQRTTKSLKIKK